jgi:hypothetical protein
MSTSLVITLPNDPIKKAALVVAFINGQDTTQRAVALEAEAESLQAMSDPTSPESMQALAAHLPVLEALFHRLAVEAVSCRQSAAKVAMMRAALQAQNSYLRTVALLGMQQQGKGCLTMETETWE